MFTVRCNMVYGKLSTLLIFHEITEVSLCGIIISSITRTNKYNKLRTFQLQVIAQFDIFSFRIIILSNRKSEVPKHLSEQYKNQVFLTTYTSKTMAN